MNMASTFLGGNRNSRFDSPSYYDDGSRRMAQLPTIKQLLPGASENFGISQGEGNLKLILKFWHIQFEFLI